MLNRRAMKALTALLLATLVGCAADDASSTSQSLTQVPGACGSIETHVFGIYEAPSGDATVTIYRPGKHAIVLSAHEATHWQVKAAAGVEIEAVYATGIGKQTISAPAGAHVLAESQVEGGPYACGFAWGERDSGCDTDQLIKLVDKRVHPVTSFHGCYEAASFKVGDDLAVTSDCNPAMGVQNDFVENCDGEDSCGGPILF